MPSVRIARRSKEAPYLIPIGERAEEIARQFHEGQLDTVTALEELTKLREEALAADDARKETKLSVDGFGVYWLLRHRMELDEAEPIAEAADRVFDAHPHWKAADAEEREVRRSLYKVLLDAKVENITEVVGGLLAMLKST